MATSVMFGTLVSWCSPEASRQAAISFRTAFLAPKACTSPSSAPAALTTRFVTLQVLPVKGNGSGRGEEGAPDTLGVVLQPYQPDRNIALELIRVTEAAAIAAARWSGRGDKNAADGAAVDAMRFVLGGGAIDGNVAIGEGEKDDAPMLYNGEQIGDGRPPLVDIAVDPVDGTTLTAMSTSGGRPSPICSPL